MPHAPRNRTLAPTRTASLLAGVAGLALMLTACGGGSALEGEYFAEDGKLVIDGNSVTYRPIRCGGDEAWIEEEPTAEGELNEEGTAVRWASDEEVVGSGGTGSRDEVGGTESVSSEEFDSETVITIGESEFTSGDEEEVLDLYLEDRTSTCS